MIPSKVLTLESISLTATGKVDRRALPEPSFEEPTLGEHEGGPLNPIEQKMADIWAEVLGLDRFSIQSNFFEFGGHSLLASQVIARTNQRFNVALSIRHLCEQPTVASLIETVQQAQKQSDAGLVKKDLAALLDSIDALSEEEAQTLLEKETRDSTNEKISYN